jgi:hypothetical protein
MPNIADPDTHLDVQILAICIAIDMPQRVFMGTEEARLASIQDNQNWNKKVQKVHNTHCTPIIVRPFWDRMIACRVVRAPAGNKYFVKWPDIYSISEIERADITGKLVRALAEYVKSGAAKMFPPLEFLTLIMNFSETEASRIIEAALDAVDDPELKKIVEFEPEMAGQPGQSGAAGARRPVAAESTLVVNPMQRCNSGGKPGFKWGNKGKCYTYSPGDQASIRRAKRKSRLQGRAIEASKLLNAMEKEDAKKEKRVKGKGRNS